MKGFVIVRSTRQYWLPGRQCYFRPFVEPWQIAFAFEIAFEPAFDRPGRGRPVGTRVGVT